LSVEYVKLRGPGLRDDQLISGEGLVFKADGWLYHSTLGSRVIKKKKKISCNRGTGSGFKVQGLVFSV